MKEIVTGKKGDTAGRAEKFLFAAYLAGFFITVLYLALTQPYLDTPPSYPNPPDEHARYLIPQFICKYGTLPTGFEEEVRVPGGLNGSYAFQPVFPYIIMGYLMRLFASFSASDAVLIVAARMVNVASGLGMACVVYALAKRVFDTPSLRWLFCFGVMYLPQHLFLHSYVNTESMCMLSIAMMLYALVCLYRDGPDKKNHILLAAGAALCVQTYYNAYGYLVCGALLYILYYMEKTPAGGVAFRWRTFFRNGLPVLLFVIVTGGAWFLREAALLDGDFTGVSTNNAMREGVVIPPSEQGVGFFELFRTRPVLRWLLESTVARFGSMSIIASPRYYLAYECYIGLGLCACAVRAVFRREKNPLRIRFHLCTGLAVLITVALWVYYVYWIDYQPQGRYILPVLLPVYYAVCRGYEFLTERIGSAKIKTVTLAVPVLFVAVALFHYVFKLCRSVYAGL